MSPFDDDVREPVDERVLEEGRKRLRMANLSDQQISEWIATTRKRGGRFELTVDGLRAVYS